MGINLSIKGVPAEKVALLKQRAKRNHRSLQGELLALVDQAIGFVPHVPETIAGLADQDRKFVRPDGIKKLSIEEIFAKVQKLKITGKDEAVQMIREDRDR